MKLMQGKIGNQESALLAFMSVLLSSAFTLDSEHAYAGGNSTYVSVPASILLSLGVFLLTLYAMQRSGKNTLRGLFDHAFGRAAGVLCSGLLMALLIVNAFLLVSNFVRMIHSFVFTDARYEPLILWVMIPIGFVAYGGLERIGRTAKCFGILLAVLILASVIAAIGGYEAYRLYPLMANGALDIGLDSLAGTVRALPALAAMLCLVDGMQGYGSVRRGGMIAALAAAVLAAALQMAIGLTYTYSRLQDMVAPVYQLNMVTVTENYLLRHDKIVLLLWLMSCMVTAAYYLYSAARLYCHTWGIPDARPPVLGGCAFVACLAALQNRGAFPIFKAALDAVDTWLFAFGMAPMLVASAVGLIRTALRRRRQSDVEKA